MLRLMLVVGVFAVSSIAHAYTQYDILHLADGFAAVRLYASGSCSNGECTVCDVTQIPEIEYLSYNADTVADVLLTNWSIDGDSRFAKRIKVQFEKRGWYFHGNKTNFRHCVTVGIWNDENESPVGQFNFSVEGTLLVHRRYPVDTRPFSAIVQGESGNGYTVRETTGVSAFPELFSGFPTIEAGISGFDVRSNLPIEVSELHVQVVSGLTWGPAGEPDGIFTESTCAMLGSPLEVDSECEVRGVLVFIDPSSGLGNGGACYSAQDVIDSGSCPLGGPFEITWASSTGGFPLLSSFRLIASPDVRTPGSISAGVSQFDASTGWVTWSVMGDFSDSTCSDAWTAEQTAKMCWW